MIRNVVILVWSAVAWLCATAQTSEPALESALSALNDISSLISQQEHNIVHLEAQLNSISVEQQLINDSITSHKWQMAQLRTQYATVVRSINVHSSPLNRLAYVFSAHSFTQAWQRASSLRQLSLWREQKSKEITHALSQLKEREQRIAHLTTIKRASLKACHTTRMTLQARLDQATALIVSLSKPSQLQAVLHEKKVQAQQLEQKLNQISTSAQYNEPSQELTTLKGSLSQPVTGRYSIVGHYGRQPHPTLQHVFTFNNGIDISCMDTPATATSVASGIVTGIYNQDANTFIVMIRHGKFLSVYGGLSHIVVKKGQPVTAKQPLGEISNYNHQHIMHFELRHEQNPLNPEEYLNI